MVDSVCSAALFQEICSLLEKRSIEVVHPLFQRERFYSTYFVVPKHPILDLSRLNKLLTKLPFRMLRKTEVLRSVTERDWFMSVDLMDAYFHVPIAVHHRKLLLFSFRNQT